MSLELTGTITFIGDTGTFGASGFRKRIIALNDGGQYPQEIGFEFTQDKCDILNGYNVGDNVKISYNLRGNRVEAEFGGEPRFYNSLQGWRIEKV